MRIVIGICILVFLYGCTHRSFESHTQLTADAVQYKKIEFRIGLNESFNNPYDQREIALNMLLTTPSGKSISLPCYYETRDREVTIWMARFTPRESGKYIYRFECIKANRSSDTSPSKSFTVASSEEDGFLHINDAWTLRFDSGKPFRGIGENIGWEPRSFANQKWTYDYLLPRLSQNGANFFRSWMAPNNFPLEWKTVKSTKLYSNTDKYFNPGGVQRLDEVVELADSLGLYMMLAFDSHNTLIKDNQWEIHNYNIQNGGPASSPEEFFTLKESRERYKNRLRYIIARWGYSPSIAAWEFFNEIDNAAFAEGDSVIIPLEAIRDWHEEMAAYLKHIDPYDHIVTTSVSHREIPGLYSIKDIDLNQMHIYKRTRQIPQGIKRYLKQYNKPFAWGEFAYEWDWNKDFSVIGDEMDFDYKRGLWYGLFSPTPILPMSWWWEYFDERGMTPYFRNVREINDLMLKSGNGSFETVEVQASGVEAYAVKCGATYFVYLLNNNNTPQTTDVRIASMAADDIVSAQLFDPSQSKYSNYEAGHEDGNGAQLKGLSLGVREDVIIILRTNQR